LEEEDFFPFMEQNGVKLVDIGPLEAFPLDAIWIGRVRGFVVEEFGGEEMDWKGSGWLALVDADCLDEAVGLFCKLDKNRGTSELDNGARLDSCLYGGQEFEFVDGLVSQGMEADGD
jgi:hypothetical protein